MLPCSSASRRSIRCCTPSSAWMPTPRWTRHAPPKRRSPRDACRGPLHGVPIGVKDIIDVAGLPTTCHSKILLDNVAQQDAAVVARLRQAGAIIIGKLSTHEFAIGGPSFDLPFPPARNPWNPEHHPGGSSSGSGAGVCAGLFPVALGIGHRRLGAQSGQRLRHRRAEADLWPGVAARRVSAVVHARPCRPADPHGGRQRADAGRDGRARSRRSRQRGDRRAHFGRLLDRGVRDLRDRLRAAFPRDRHAGASRGHRGAGRCRARAAGRRRRGPHDHAAVAERIRRRSTA